VPTTADWEDVRLHAAVEELPSIRSPYDFVVVDEAQDLTEQDWILIEELARDRLLWAFHYPAQRYWPERIAPARLFSTRFKVPTQHRCHPAILALAQAYSGTPLNADLVRDAMAAATCPANPAP
jgi:hypothetical protein